MDYNWRQPNPTDLQDAGDPPVPDTETLLAELGAFYPVYPAVSYPAAQEEEQEPEEAVEQAIFAGLVSG
jgi:hypothetical protein